MGTGTGMDAPASIAPSAAPRLRRTWASAPRRRRRRRNRARPPRRTRRRRRRLRRRRRRVSPCRLHRALGERGDRRVTPAAVSIRLPRRRKRAALWTPSVVREISTSPKRHRPAPPPARPRAKATSAPMAPASDLEATMSAIRSRPQLKSAAATRRAPLPSSDGVRTRDPGRDPARGGAMTTWKSREQSRSSGTAITGGGGGVDAAGIVEGMASGLAAFSRGRGFRGGPGRRATVGPRLGRLGPRTGVWVE